MPQIFDLNVDGMVIDVRSKPSKYTKKILSFYQKALKETLKSSPQLNYILKELKDQIKDVSAGGITRGNFKRGIMIKEVN
jgi:collagenase-like PrtC family protease